MELSKNLSYQDVYNEELKRYLTKEFARMKDECYLDHAGATLYSSSQIKNVSDNLLSTIYANPHSTGVVSGFTHDSIESIRYKILEHFHTTSEEYTVIFTSGATSSIKIVAETFEFSIDENEKGNFVYTQDNHTSILGIRELVKNKSEIIPLPKSKLLETFNCRKNATKTAEKIEPKTETHRSLFAYSAQCNFSGYKSPLSWIEKVHNGALDHLTQGEKSSWYVLLDAAAYCATNDLDLSVYKPDFVCLSFYKMFGYPTGIGALIVRNSSANALRKNYYGGGTVNISLSSTLFHVKRNNLSERFEDGSLPFISIVSLQPGLKMISNIGMDRISMHVFSLARFLHHSLMILHHSNGQPVVKLYSDTNYEDKKDQGGIVTFNILRPNGDFVGYMQVLHMAEIYKIHLRTGCFCNPGACQRHMGLTNDEVMQNYDAGYVCGGNRDLINGRPTGAVRISFGYMSRLEDAQTVLKMVRESFLDGTVRIKVPPELEDETANPEKLFVANSEKENEENENSIQKPNGILYQNTKIKKEKQILHEIENEHKRIHEMKNVSNNKDDEPRIKLKHLFLYPIKSCGAYEVKGTWKLGRRGLKYDREWMIVTSGGVCLTQKQEIKMCLIKPRLDLKKMKLILSYPTMPEIEVSLVQKDNDFDGQICRGKICGHKVEGTDCGINVSEWLSLALGRPRLRLIRQSSNENDYVYKELSFASQAQYLLINESSINWLADKVPEDSDFEKQTMLHRFRGNMVVSGCEAFDETKWTEIRIGQTHFQIEGPCTRCQMICIDQTSGRKTIEPLKSLASELRGKINFGIYMFKKTNNETFLSVGDTVYIS